MDILKRCRGLKFAWEHLRRYLTVRKIVNIALVKVEAALKAETVMGRPYDIRVEPTNICNTSCQLCPTGTGLPGRAKGHMTLEQYKQIVDEGSPWIYRLSLFMWGDPFISKDIFQMISYAHKAGIWTNVNSNLHAFHPSQGHDVALVESGLDNLACSLHGATQETFQIYQPGKNLESTVRKMEALIRTRDHLGTRNPRVLANFVITRFNEHEVPTFKEQMRNIGCEPVVWNASLNLRFLARDITQNLTERDRQMQERMAEWLPSNPELVRLPYRMMREGRLRWDDLEKCKIMPCKWLWKSTVINQDGTVAPCCGAWGAEEDYGDLNKDSFRQIWNGPNYRAGRRSFKQPSTDPIPCAKCPGGLL